MKISDFPARDCCILIWGIIDRHHSAKDRQPLGRDIKTEVHLTIDDARMIWAASQWLKRYDDWEKEARAAGGSIGVYPADTSLSYAAKWLGEKVAAINKEHRVITFTPREMMILRDCSFHLDHYALMTSFKESRRGWRRK